MNGDLFLHEEHKYYNTHSLYVFTSVGKSDPPDFVGEEELREIFQTLVDEAVKKYGPEMNTSFRINYVRKIIDRVTKETRPAGYAYIYFINPKFFNMVVGRKPDGTDLVELVPDPNWVPPKKSTPSLSVGPSGTTTVGRSISMSWADEDEATPPMLRRALSPMLSEPSAKRTISDEEGVSLFPLSIMPAYVVDPERDVESYKLMSKMPIPHWIDEGRLKKHFQIYSSNGMIDVKFTRQRKAIVLFSPSQSDGLFARQMEYVNRFAQNDR